MSLKETKEEAMVLLKQYMANLWAKSLEATLDGCQRLQGGLGDLQRRSHVAHLKSSECGPGVSGDSMLGEEKRGGTDKAGVPLGRWGGEIHCSRGPKVTSL